MLSAFVIRSGAYGSSLLRNQAPRVLSLVPTDTKSKHTVAERIAQWDEANKMFYGPERDTKNFPQPVIPERCPKVRLGFIPDAWFQFFYNKTGVTGPYLFGIGFVTTLLSKEIWVIDHGFTEVIGFYGAIWVLAWKVGPKLANWMNTKNDLLTQERYTQPILDAKANSQEVIDSNEKAIWREEGQKYLWESKKENVALQLEAAYRKRLNEVFREVKSRLDYQLELQNVKRHFEQAHMVNWIVENVRKSITPQQEQESIRVCIAQLKTLSQPQA